MDSSYIHLPKYINVIALNKIGAFFIQTLSQSVSLSPLNFRVPFMSLLDVFCSEVSHLDLSSFVLLMYIEMKKKR